MTGVKRDAGVADTVAADDVLLLRLYVAGDGPNSSQARANLASVLESQPASSFELEVVDSLREPMRALQDGIIVTPTLVKLAPPPAQKIIGTLCERVKVLAALGITGTQRV